MNALAPPVPDRIDYRPCRYGGSRLMFRGPARALDGRHLTALGGTATFGRGVARPWPEMVEEALGLEIANLGYPAAGIDVFLSEPALLDAAGRGRATVIEAMDAACLSNRYYGVHPRRNDRFLAPSPLLRRMCPSIDWTEFTFVRHMLQSVGTAHPDAFAILRGALREAWLERMRALIAALDGPVVLLWLGRHDPRDPAACAVLGGAPLFVDAAMLQALRPSIDAVLTCIAAPEGGPDGGTDPPGGRAHVRAARAVTVALEGIL